MNHNVLYVSLSILGGLPLIIEADNLKQEGVVGALELHVPNPMQCPRRLLAHLQHHRRQHQQLEFLNRLEKARASADGVSFRGCS